MSAADFFVRLEESLLGSINTAMPAEVLGYDEDARTAKIKPLIRVQVGENEFREREVLENVPVLKNRYKVDGGSPRDYVPVLQAGDIVQVVFNQSAIDQAQDGEVVNPSGRRFSVTDAVIVGVF